MAYILFPGRHHVLTQFQQQYLNDVLTSPAHTLLDRHQKPLTLEGRLDSVVWAVTSANHSLTRRNPLPLHRRLEAIHDFSFKLQGESFVYPIADVTVSDHFAHHTLAEIEMQSQGKHYLCPANTVVATSTPEVIPLYEALGFQILPMELQSWDGKQGKVHYKEFRPWDMVLRMVKVGKEAWRKDVVVQQKTHPATLKMLYKYGLGDLIIEVHSDPLLKDDGDITTTRDYKKYMLAFDEGAARKVELVKDHIVPGRIVDIGCCTGSIIREMQNDPRLWESDFFGIEAAQYLFRECEHRRAQGYFPNENTFFHHRNYTQADLFSPNSVHTITTFSLTHEIESYQGKEALDKLVKQIHKQLAKGGRWINVDVVGPQNKDQIVYMKLCDTDGTLDAPSEMTDRGEFAKRLMDTSTYGRFIKFGHDFRQTQGDGIHYKVVQHGEDTYVQLTLQDACEFMGKKDYTDNWKSEMHEKFCNNSLNDWKRIAESCGLRIHPQSRTFCNPWIVENRYRGKVQLYQLDGNKLTPMEYPPTTMVLIAEKP